jgi:hypothetical protein
VIAAESFLLHDPLRLDRPFARLSSLLDIENQNDGALLFRDRLNVSGDAWLVRNPAVTGKAAGMATVLMLGPDSSLLPTKLRTGWMQLPGHGEAPPGCLRHQAPSAESWRRMAEHCVQASRPVGARRGATGPDPSRPFGESNEKENSAL